MNPKVAASVIVSAVVGAAAIAVLGGAPTRTQGCELLLPDGGIVSATVTVSTKVNTLAACVDAAAAEARRRQGAP